MKNTIKKAICTTLAVVSLSAMVAVPSSLNAPESDNAIVKIIEAEAWDDVAAMDIYMQQRVYDPKAKYYRQWDEPWNLEYKIYKDDLTGRTKPDGTEKVVKFKKGETVKIKQLKIVKSDKTKECRLWGLTSKSYKYKLNGKEEKKQVWVCLKRAMKPKKGANGKFEKLTSNATCQGAWGTSLDVKLGVAIQGNLDLWYDPLDKEHKQRYDILDWKEWKFIRLRYNVEKNLWDIDFETNPDIVKKRPIF